MGSRKLKSFYESFFLCGLEPCHDMVLHGMGIAVDTAVPGACIMGYGHGCLDDCLQHMVQEIHAEVGGHVVDDLSGHLVLDPVIVLRLYLFPSVHSGQDSHAEGTGPFGRNAGIAVVVADTGQIAVGAKAREIIIQKVGVHGIAPEDAVVLYIQLLRGPVQDQDDREGRQGKTPSVDHLCGLFGHFADGLDHAGIDRIGIGRGDHVIGIDLVSSFGADAVCLPVLYQDLVHLLAVFDLYAHLFRTLRHLEAHLMAELFGDHGSVAHVVGHQHGINGKGQVRKAAAHIDPVG